MAPKLNYFFRVVQWEKRNFLHYGLSYSSPLTAFIHYSRSLLYKSRDNICSFYYRSVQRNSDVAVQIRKIIIP